MSGLFGLGAGAGFVMLAMVPLLFTLSILGRGLGRGWAPVMRGLVEPHGGAPVLAAWIAYAVFALVALAIGTFGATLLIARTTMFRPMVVGYAQPAFGVAMLLVLLLGSRPAATVLARVFSRRGAAFRPRRIAVTLALIAVLLVGGAWLWVRPRIGPLDLGPLVTPSVGIAGLVLAHVAIERWTRTRLWIAGLASGFATAAIACALVAWRTQPSVTLEAWGELPVAGFVIDKVFDLEAIRDRISLDSFRPVARPDAEHPDVVVIIIDTVRADRTPPYGGPAAMPYLDQLAKRGTVFDHAFSPSNVTRRSIPSMLTGLSPQNVRGRVVGWALRIDPRHVVLGERMSAAGYDTAGFVCCGGLYGDDLRTGFDRGMSTLVIDESAEMLGAKAGRFVTAKAERGDKRPLFMWLHFLEPHNWSVNTAVSGTASDQYDRSLAMVDRALVPLIAAFSNRPTDDAPIIIVTSDHGEALGEHGQRNHSTDLYNSQIRVPLVIAGPTVTAVRPTETVGLVDLVPTIIDLAGFEPPHGRSIDGRSIADLARGQPSTAPGRAFSAMIADRSNPGGVSAIVDGPWKLIETHGVRELFNVHQDPDERANVAAKHPEIVGRLAAMLGAQRARARVSAFD